MARRPMLRILLLALAAAACRLDPPGRCATRSDCAPGLDCLNGVCAACAGDGDCAAWQLCGTVGLCDPRPGRCAAAADCASWQVCDATHVCVLGPGHCADDTACDAAQLQRCDPAHDCSLAPARCFADADCLPWAPTCDVPTNRCKPGTAPGDDVLAWGTLVEGRCDRGAVSRATTAAATTGVVIGFDCGSGGDRKGYVDPLTGELVYRHVGDVGGDTLRRLYPDALTWDAAAATWRYPASPSENDLVALSTAACPDSWDRWVMQGGTGALLFGCPVVGGALWDFYDAAGVRRVQALRALHAWNAAGYLLVTASDGTLRVLTGTGSATTVTGLPAGARLAYRTSADAWVNPIVGFRVALHDDASGKDELWEIDQGSAAAAIAGTYPSVASSYGGVTWDVLDSAGSLYGTAYLDSRDRVLKRVPAAASTVETYSEASMPAGSDDFGAATFKPFLRLDASFLVSMP